MGEVTPGARLSERLAALRERFVGAAIDALIVSHGPNIFYLTNFQGSAGFLVVGPNETTLIIDSRYTAAVTSLLAGDGACPGLLVSPVETSYEESVAGLLRQRDYGRVGIEPTHLTVAQHAWLQRTLQETGPTIVPAPELVEAGRIVKDADELSALREGGRRISRVMAEALEGLEPGREEREVAANIDWAIRRAGFERPAFETIVASGSQTALPHAHPGERRLARGDLVLLDFGGVYRGYCVDMTRVASLGTPVREIRDWHEGVREAQRAALAAIRPGVGGCDVDAAARDVLERYGWGDAFGHGTGHGLGLEVHEAPRVGKAQGPATDRQKSPDGALRPGMVVTVEPGVYFPGRGGIRLEDDVVVTSTGYDLLTDLSSDLVVV